MDLSGITFASQNRSFLIGWLGDVPHRIILPGKLVGLQSLCQEQSGIHNHPTLLLLELPYSLIYKHDPSHLCAFTI